MLPSHERISQNRSIFAAITGAGPLIGPVLAAQFSFLPGLLWLVIGVVMGGAVHDFIILYASVRRNGRSLAEIARTEISSVAGATAMVVHPDLKMPAFTQFVHGNGPIIPGALFPFVFVTIACGAISGFHSLISSGTTPKMIMQESHIRPIGYGAMLIESFVGVTSLIAACALFTQDYFAINADPDKFHELGMVVVNLPELSREVGEELVGRTGGAVSLAVGMAQIFSGLPGLKGLMSYWYHFAIMFEALFILTTIDTGTRVARFLVQEFFGRFYKPFERTDWLPGTIFSTGLVVASGSYFILTGSINPIWPMFGISNQLLAGIALCVATVLLLNAGRRRYVWVTALPMAFVFINTLTAGWFSVTDNFWPLAHSADPSKSFQGWLNTLLTLIMMGLALLILGNAFWVVTQNAHRKDIKIAERS